MMRILGKTAIYQEKQFELLAKKDDKYSLFSKDADDTKIGFVRVGNNDDKFVKDILLEELDFVFDMKTIVTYKGEEFIGSIIEGNMIMLYTFDIALGKKYNMIMRDRNEYYLYVELKDVDEIIQKWIPINKYNIKCKG